MDVDLDSYIKDKGIGFVRGGRGRPTGNSRRRGRISSSGMISKQPLSQPTLDLSSGATLHVSNLDFGVSNQDVGELFGEFGPMKRFALHFDQTGRSLGTAEVHYVNSQSAMRALSRYNGVPLDGRPMKLEISGNLQKHDWGGRISMHGGRFRDRDSNLTGGRERGRGGNRRLSPPSKEVLDAELETLVKLE